MVLRARSIMITWATVRNANAQASDLLNQKLRVGSGNLQVLAPGSMRVTAISRLMASLNGNTNIEIRTIFFQESTKFYLSEFINKTLTYDFFFLLEDFLF